VPKQRTYVASARDRRTPLRVRRGQGAAPHPQREGKRNRLSGWVLTASVLRLLRALARSPALAHTRVLARPLFRLALLALRLGSLPRALSLRPPSSPPHSRSVGSSTRLLLRFLFVGSLVRSTGRESSRSRSRTAMDPTTLLPFDSELSLQDLSAGGHNLSFVRAAPSYTSDTSRVVGMILLVF